MAHKNSLASTVSKTSRGSSLWDPELKSIMESESGSKIMKDVATKRELRRARKLFEATAQSQSPSKDFVALLITEKGIIWTKWKITLRGYTSGGAAVPQPQEEIMSFTDFKCNDSLLDEVRRSFGASTLHHIERIISGSNDVLSCTPEPLMLHICAMLDLQSISQLSQANRHLRKLCMSDKLWSTLYHQHQGNPGLEICSLANDIGWRKVFYSSKLQLQKEISRRRKLALQRESNVTTTSTLESERSPEGSKLLSRDSTVTTTGAEDDPVKLGLPSPPRGSAASSLLSGEGRDRESNATFLTATCTENPDNL